MKDPRKDPRRAFLAVMTLWSLGWLLLLILFLSPNDPVAKLWLPKVVGFCAAMSIPVYFQVKRALDRTKEF